MDNLEPGTSFELEILRRLEGPPAGSANSFEVKKIVLGKKYTNALDVIRKVDARITVGNQIEPWQIPHVCCPTQLRQIGGLIKDYDKK